MSELFDRPIVRELIRFAAVGGVGVLVDFVVFNVLRATVFAPGSMAGAVLIAKAVATLLAIFANWAGNRWWTFRDRRSTNIALEMASFVTVSLIGSAIALGCLAISHYVLGLTSVLADNISANVVGLLLGSLFRFAASRRWVFRAPDRLTQTGRRGLA